MIEYKGTPLFGEDSSVSHTSEFFAIAGTVLFWLIFLIFSFVIKPQPKKKYKEVQIVLSSTPVVQKSEAASAPAEAASASAASEQSEVVTEAPAVETPAPQKTVSEPIEYAVDPMEAFAAQTKQQPKKEVDWDAMFADVEPEETQITHSKTVQNNEPAFSGSAGTAATSENEKVISTNNQASNTQNQQASTSTSKALEGIKKSTFNGNAANGVQSETSAKTKNSSSGYVEMEMSNGRSRALIDPERPVINISAAAAATIDTSKNLSITFKVLESGNVTEIKITPESILTAIVRDEIKNQLSKWRFEPADYTANAIFEYKIIKR